MEIRAGDVQLVIADLATLTANWLNDNQGILTLGLFLLSLFLGWYTGIFEGLRNKPKFKVSLIPGPTFVSVLGLDRKHNGYDMHRTAIALYLSVSNAGSVGAQIHRIRVGYHWTISPFGYLWWKHGLGWFWLEDQTIALDDFQVAIGDKTKGYPFLTQRSHLTGHSAATYLRPGEATNGVVYFEQPDSFGGCFPRSRGGVVQMRVVVLDVLGVQHHAKLTVPKVSLEAARAYNPSFGLTLSTLRGDSTFVDLDTDVHGNLTPPMPNGK